MKRFSDRAYLVFSGLLLIAGTLLSANGGRQHPTISNHIGAFGTNDFFRGFATLILSEPNWERIHAQILAAPLFWVLGGLALAVIARSVGETHWSTLGVVSLAMGATLWVVSYIFDGFVADHTAAWLLSGDQATTPAYTATFGANQWVSIRTHYVAWLLIAFGTTVFSIAMASLARRGAGRGRPLAVVLVVLGLALGAWSLVAVATGAFLPGPMVSLWYVPVLVGTQLWYLLAGILVIYRTLRRPRTRTTDATPAPAVRAPESTPAAVSAS
ncbi:MAG: hypothetical protein AUI14_04015 [Actinobacteria bacterium 13_2_20CM_2_71_6]|nr:MAG: hypothetical protein AUI14_04015 [Actinobacteria bacterium 13_2_20CM_2_71_6]